MKQNLQRSLLLIIIALLSVQLTTALCCLQGYNDDRNPETGLPDNNLQTCTILAPDNSNSITQTICENDLDGLWVADPATCNNPSPTAPVNDCQSGCCCQLSTGGGQTADRYACDTTNTNIIFIAESSSTPDCSAICPDPGNTPTTFHVSGAITDQSATLVSGATVTIVSYETTYTTGPNGLYNFELENGTTYTISAEYETDDEICHDSIDVTVNGEEIDDANIILATCEPISAGGGDCTPSNWDCDWTQCTPQTQYQYPVSGSCQDLTPIADRCDPPTPQAPDQAPIIPIPCPVSGTCGDGTIQPELGEQCDGTNLNGMTCDDFEMTTVTGLSCNDDCQYDISGCTVCPELNPTSSCTAEQCAIDCPACITAGLCEEELNCSTYIPTITTVSGITGTRNAYLSWIWPDTPAECQELIDHVIITRCDGINDDCDGANRQNTQSFTLTQNNWLNTATWKDETELAWTEPDAQQRKQYCYTVLTHIDYGDGTSVQTVSERHCFATGDEACMVPQHGTARELCAAKDELFQGMTTPNNWNTLTDDASTRTYCSPENYQIPLGFDPGQAIDSTSAPFDCGKDAEGKELQPPAPCLGPFQPDGNTMCGQTNICDYCNGLFAMYSYKGSITVPIYNPTRGVYDQRACSDSNIYGTYCFEQHTRTVQDEKDSCSTVSSCYDYYNKDSCEQNDCNMPGSTCLWQPMESAYGDTTIGEELGIGVCVPQNEEQQDCERCNTDDAYSPSCTASLCDLYSTDGSCFYYTGDKFADMQDTCLNPESVGCAFYTDADSCAGGQNVEVDAQYDGNERNRGTNALNQPSHDSLGFEKCAWGPDSNGQGTCIKNADNYLPIEGQYEDDCNFIGRDIKCYADNDAPTTNLTLRKNPDTWDDLYPVYGAKEGLIFTYTVTDDTYQQGETETFFGFQPVGQYWAPMTDYPAPFRENPPGTGQGACQEIIGGNYAGRICYACSDGDWQCLDDDRFGSNTVDESLCADSYTFAVLSAANHPSSMPSCPCDQDKERVDCSPSFTSQDPESCFDYASLELGGPERGNIMTSTPTNSELTPCFPQQAIDECAWRSLCNAPAEANYPASTYDDLQLLDVPSAQYLLRYYSEDKAKNLEAIHDDNIIIDATAPEIINYDYSEDTYQITADVWRTDFNITYDINESHGPASCTGNLLLMTFNTMGGFDGDTTITGTDYSFRYHSLSDGHYTMTITCADPLGNEATYNFPLSLEADKSITDPEPDMQTFNDNENIYIGIKSAYEGDCYYSATDPQPATNKANADVHPFTSQAYEDENGNTRYQHSATYTAAENAITALFTGCDFTSIGQTTEGNPGDMIIFGVDEEAPNTTLLDSQTDEPYDPQGIWANEAELTFDCDASSDALTITGMNSVTPLYYPMEAVYYCWGTSGSDCVLDNEEEEWDNDPITVTPLTVANGQNHLYYYCVDEGGNREATKESIIYVKNTDFNRPIIRVCDPLNPEQCEDSTSISNPNT